MFAVAVRDAGRLFLLVRVKRSPEGDVYVFDAHIEPKDWLGPTGWKDWNPNTSYHASGELHQKWFDKEFIIRYRPKPDSTFRGPRIFEPCQSEQMCRDVAALFVSQNNFHRYSRFLWMS